MRNTGKVFCVFICAILLFVSLFVPSAFADTVRQGKITGDAVRLRDKATTATGSNTLAYLSLGTIVQINGTVQGNEAVSGAGKTWYNVTVSGKTGYVYGKYIVEITQQDTTPTYTYNADFEKNLLNFPEDYRNALRSIHASYPNWIFVADNVSIGLDAAIELEYSASNMFSTRKWVELSYGEVWRDVRADVSNPAHIREGRWTFASREAIAYFMDPRNALAVTNEKSSYPTVFTFLEQSYNSATQTTQGLRTVVAGTFLANGYDGKADAYIEDIMAAAKESGVSPYVIASTIITEQGTKGTSGLISGTYKGYEGYYNFFNFGASGSDVIGNGLKYAKEKGWNSRRASITGGAKLYGSGYISAGQDTYYYMDFNVKNTGKLWHQYASSLYDQSVKAASMRKACIINSNAVFTFKIPVYSSMPYEPYGVPTNLNYPGEHTCTRGEPINAVPATCTEAGYSGDICCSVCEMPIEMGHVIPAKGHTPGEPTGVKEATCTEAGYTGDIYCEECGVLLTAGTDTPLKSHAPGEPVNVKKATCLEKGYTGDIYCENCGVLLSSGEVTQIADHAAGGWIIDVAADIGIDGHWHKECTVCGLLMDEKYYPALTEKNPGDINGDGVTNNKDLTRLFQYLSDWDIAVSTSALDVNGDGALNNKDLTRLFQYLADWEVEIY